MLIVNLLYKYNFGGAEKVAESYAKVLNNLGYETQTIGVKAKRNNQLNNLTLVNTKVDYFLYLLKNFRGDKVFFCHCNFALISIIVISFFLRKKNERLFYVQHLEYTSSKRKLIYWLVNRFFDGYIEIKGHSYKEISIINSNKIYKIHNFSISSSDESSINSANKLNELQALKTEGYKLYLFVGAVKEGKGVEHLIHIARQLSAIRSKYKIVFVGDGDELKNFKSKVTASNLDNEFIFCGFSSSPDLFMKLSDTLLFTSDRSEVTPMVVIESIDNNLPIVAFDLPFNRRYLDSRCLFGVGDYKGIASYLEQGRAFIHSNKFNESYALDKFRILLESK
ncbi:glycosyltransferase [Vibrio cyclitrophicus]